MFGLCNGCSPHKDERHNNAHLHHGADRPIHNHAQLFDAFNLQLHLFDTAELYLQPTRIDAHDSHLHDIPAPVLHLLNAAAAPL